MKDSRFMSQSHFDEKKKLYGQTQKFVVRNSQSQNNRPKTLLVYKKPKF